MRRQFTCILSYAIIVCTLLAYVIYEYSPQRNLMQVLSPSELFYNVNDEEPIDEEQTCRVPILNPYDKSIMPYFSMPKPIICRVRHEAFTHIDDMGRIRLNKTAFTVSGYKPESLWCYYQSIKRTNNSDSDVDLGPIKAVVDAADIMDEFISVWCKNYWRITVYTNMHAHVVPIPRFLQDANASQTETSKRSDGSEKMSSEGRIRKPNVLILVLDSMSRLNFIRQLPMTYLQLVRTLGSVVLRGFTKVGDNTFPNLVALLTGKRAKLDLPLLGGGETYDDWPCLWKNFSAKGYVTMLAEDMPHLALFNYRDAGFRNQPTDHYMRPFWLALDTSLQHKLSSNLCYGATPKHLYQLSYVSQFVRKYHQVPYLAISFLSELSHDYINQVGAADTDFASFFQGLHEGGYLNDTVMVVMGDHGFRFGSIRLTAVGRIEDKMPFATVFLPHQLQTRHPSAMDALKRNSKRLTSAFDLHRTIMDLIDNESNNNGDSVDIERELQTPALGVNLLSDVSAQRTCEQAGVPDEFCTCDDEQRLVLGNPLVKVAATALTNSLNEKTKEHRSMCAVLTLKRIREAAVLVAQSVGVGRNKTEQDLDRRNKVRVTIEVNPSGGQFEGTITFHWNNITVLPDISRLNRYGSQASCVVGKILAKNPDLTKFCYCTVRRQ